MRILFIGNSHTYFNDMPAIVADFASTDGIPCAVTMIAHGGWYLSQHIEEPDVSFNIRCGHYAYVVLQEYSHPFGPVEGYFDSVRTLVGWIRDAGSTPVIYMTWAKKDEPEKQAEMTTASRQIAAETNSLLAPVGELWQQFRAGNPDIEMYWEDGAHASPEGSRFAAQEIWKVIRADLQNRRTFGEVPESGQNEEAMEEMRVLGAMMEEYILDEL